MSSTWKTGSSVFLEKGKWNTAIKQDWIYLFSANKYSCENMDILAQESQTESHSISTNKLFGIPPEDKSLHFQQVNTVNSLKPN